MTTTISDYRRRAIEDGMTISKQQTEIAALRGRIQELERSQPGRCADCDRSMDSGNVAFRMCRYMQHRKAPDGCCDAFRRRG